MTGVPLLDAVEIPCGAGDFGFSVTKVVVGPKKADRFDMETVVLKNVDPKQNSDLTLVEWHQRLEATITSPALPSVTRWRVGQAVRRGSLAYEPVQGALKVECEPVLVCGLVSLAVAGMARAGKANMKRLVSQGQTLTVRYNLFVTSLPYGQYGATGERYKALLKAQHTLQFHDLPGIGDLTVVLHLRNVHVQPEGLPAAYSYVYELSPSGQIVVRPGREQVLTKAIGVGDFGGGTSDILIFDDTKGKWSLNTDESYTIEQGINAALDTAVATLKEKNLTRYASRAAIVELLRDDRRPLTERAVESARDEISIPLVKVLENEPMHALGREVKTQLEQRWTENIGTFLIVGGGAELLNHFGYLKTKFKAKPIILPDPEWANAVGGFLFGTFVLQQRQEQKGR